MTSYKGKAGFVLTACCLIAAAMLSSAQSDITQDDGGQDVQLSLSNDDSAQSNIRRLTGQTDANLHTTSLHQSAKLGEVSDTSLGSISYKYSMHGIQKGAPATCYGSPCTASACYPSALVSVKTHVNYVNVTAVVEFSRRYNVSCFTLVRPCYGMTSTQLYFIIFLAAWSAYLVYCSSAVTSQTRLFKLTCIPAMRPLRCGIAA